MQIAKQFSIFMVNKPGILAKVLTEFAKSKVNIIAMTMMDSAEHGVMRVVFSDPIQAPDNLQKRNQTVSETEILCIILDNKTGALAGVVEKLAKNHINISYAYCTAGARGGKTTGVLKVANVNKAIKIIEPNAAKKSKKITIKRRKKK